MKALFKSRLLEFSQCPKRMWLQLHAPQLRNDSARTQASFSVGMQIGDAARRIYDPKGNGALISIAEAGFEAAFSRTAELLASSRPIFEAGFSAGGASSFADVLLPVRRNGKAGWRMVEVKSSTGVKDYHRLDAAIQAYVARTAGVPLLGVSVAHVDSNWVYPGGEDYNGLLVEHDLTDDVGLREAGIKSMIGEAHGVAAKRKEPGNTPDAHCSTPFECGFADHCNSGLPQAEYPVGWLPRVTGKALREAVSAAADLREIADELLNEKQLRVKQCTLTGKTYFNAELARQMLKPHRLPAYFIDFETIQFAVPVWKGTRPYQQIPYQFSAHRLGRNGRLEASGFLDLSGRDPSRPFAEALIGACGDSGPVFVYNAKFERSRIEELAERFPRLRPALLAIAVRLVDLLPVAEACYYHPSQQGSWSIKKVLPAVAPELCYDDLDGVQDGGMATDAYLEAISPGTSASRKAVLKAQLENYCSLDTFAMVRLWQFFAGRDDITI